MEIAGISLVNGQYNNMVVSILSWWSVYYHGGQYIIVEVSISGIVVVTNYIIKVTSLGPNIG